MGAVDRALRPAQRGVLPVLLGCQANEVATIFVSPCRTRLTTRSPHRTSFIPLMSQSTDKHTPSEGLDLAGIGKLAQAIPPEVYTRTASVVLASVESLISPITATTVGLGDFIRQKFRNMTDIERALGEHALRLAVAKAAKKAQGLNPPLHFKSFVSALEHASKEVDPLLHEMWINLLASELTGGAHPHFVQTLSHFSVKEAKLLLFLCDYNETGYSVGGMGGRAPIIGTPSGGRWVRKSDDVDSHEWDLSCSLLLEFGLAAVMGAKNRERDGARLLFRSPLGTAFLEVVQE